MKFMKKLSLLVLALLFLVGCQAKPATDDTDSSTFPSLNGNVLTSTRTLTSKPPWIP